MKKIISLLLSLFLCLSLLPLAAIGAEKGKMTLSGDVDGLERGARFQVDVELNRNPGVTSLRATVEFDPKVLEVVKIEKTGPLPGYNADVGEGEIILRWKRDGAGSDLTTTGKIARITFGVLEDAVYGESRIDLNIDQKLYDAQNSRGEAVPFDTQGLKYNLICPHATYEITVLQEATFETAGIAAETCPDCGETREISLLPTLVSEDGKTTATLAVGEYLDSDEKSVRIEYLFGGEEAVQAKKLFGDDMVRAFRIYFTKGPNEFTPSGECDLEVQADFEVPGNVVLYVLLDGGAEQMDMTVEDGKLHFPYQDAVYVLVSRDDTGEPEIPEETTTTTTVAPTTTLSPAEEARRHEILLICVGAAALVLCGVGMILILGKRKHF